MLLSIVLMIKNEEKHLEKTLKALEILRKSVNSELIILDTGSTDRSIEIASKYTDKIYFEKWNDDFGQMRNKSISYAKGEWILVLDADEELVNCDKMIKFFNTPLHKEYNSASIELKNINSEDNKLYTKSINIRVFKNTGFRYEGIIHEQPMYKEPTYNNIAIFNHYGYLYTDEEQKKYKLQRNEKLLLKVLKKKPIDSYANFQMAKNLMAMDENEEAIYYMEKSFEICKKNGNIPAYVQSNLAKLYLILEKYTKCENICIDYIEKDTKNIDIYYYLALSQSMNNKYNDSLINYKRYIYLLENYEISTQYNDILCDGNTIGLRDQAEVYIVKIYYLLEEYNKVYDTISKLKMEQIRSIYSIIFMSIIKVNKIESILNLYENLNSNVEKNEFKLELEKVLLKTSESNRKKLYHILKEIEGNYGTLNKVRSGKFINLDEYRRMLTEENDDYYSILIDYAFKEGFEIEDILKGIDKTHIQDYFDYMIEYRNGNTIDLYEYLLTRSNTLEINKLKIYSSLCKSLLNANYNDEKYLILFYMYITYTYDYLRLIYNNELSDEQLLNLIGNKEEKFVIDLVNTRRLKKYDKLTYIRKIKKMIVANQSYKKGIKILIDKFQNEIEENQEVKKLKKQYKYIIENSINNGNINEATLMIDEYINIFKNNELENLKGIISIYKNDLKESEMFFKLAYIKNNEDIDLLFNIAYLKELKQEYDECIKFYKKFLSLCTDEKIKNEVINKIKDIKKHLGRNDSDLELYKKSVKDNIENLINHNKIDEAKEELELYKANIPNDISIYSIEGIIHLCEGELDKAYTSFYDGLKIDSDNFDLLYNFAYTNLLLGNEDEAIEIYNKCINLTDNQALIDEINNTIENLDFTNFTTIKNKNIIMLDVKEDDIIVNLLDKENNDVVLLKKNDDINGKNKTEKDNLIIYEANVNNYLDIIEKCMKKNKSTIIMCKNINNLDFVNRLNYSFKLVYYRDKEISIDNGIYCDLDKAIYNEIQAYDSCDLIITNSIETYANKKIIENNEKIYLFNESLQTYTNINYILENYKYMQKNQLYKEIESKIFGIEDEYEILLYKMVLKYESNCDCLELAKYIYDKYDTVEIYKIYISLLIKNKDYKNLINVVINSQYSSEVIKAEVVYLKILEKYDLLEFVSNISIKNYSCLGDITGDDLEYKMALCHFELGNFYLSYNKYISLLKINDCLSKSPMVNKNIGYMMYVNRKDEYKNHYNIYKQIVACLY